MLKMKWVPTRFEFLKQFLRRQIFLIVIVGLFFIGSFITYVLSNLSLEIELELVTLSYPISYEIIDRIGSISELALEMGLSVCTIFYLRKFPPNWKWGSLFVIFIVCLMITHVYFGIDKTPQSAYENLRFITFPAWLGLVVSLASAAVLLLIEPHWIAKFYGFLVGCLVGYYWYMFVHNGICG
jgi:hypothetical protein